MSATKVKTYSLAFLALFIAGAIVAFPKAAVDASLSGLKMWWNIVFPSLLPFFIMSELLIGFGIVTFIGVLLEPLMRPIFKVPGVGGFVFVMGLASGFPAGAKITARLYEQKKLTKTEAERLASFTNFSNPLFMFGVLAVGFFSRPELGLIFALSHYIGNIAVGLVMRFYHRKEVATQSQTRATPKIIVKAFRDMHQERIRNHKPIGKMLGDAVHTSVTTLLMVGGFIIMFSVFNRILDEVHATEILALGLQHLLVLLHLDPSLSRGIIPGLFELTNGAKRISELQAPLYQAVIVTSFLLGFSGFSIQAQVASILSEVKLNIKPFFIGRLFHGVFSSFAALFLLNYFRIDPTQHAINPVMSVTTSPLPNSLKAIYPYVTNWLHWGSILTLITLITFILYNAFLKTRESVTKI